MDDGKGDARRALIIALIETAVSLGSAVAIVLVMRYRVELKAAAGQLVNRGQRRRFDSEQLWRDAQAQTRRDISRMEHSG